MHKEDHKKENIMEIVGLIPARGGSKRLPGKNIKPLAGKPMIAYTIEAALNARYLDKVIVSTDSEDIKKISLSCGAEVPFMRPDELSGNKVSDLPVMQHALDFFSNDGYDADAIVYLRPTSPFKTSDVIDEVVDKFWQTNADVVRTIAPVEGVFHPYWMFSQQKDGRVDPFIPGIKISKYYQSQLLPPAFRMTGVVDLFSTKSIIQENIFDNENTFSVEISPEIAIDIDTSLDFKFCEQIINQQNRKKF
jgi:CMP-N,N'-diacetyllegionaminic acid synthase